MADITGLLASCAARTPPAEPYHPAVERRKAGGQAAGAGAGCREPGARMTQDAHRTTRTTGGRHRRESRGHGRRHRGARPSPRCSATPARPRCSGPAGTELAEAINETHENPDYLPGITLTGALRATSRPGRGAGGRRPGRAGRARADAAGEPGRLGRAAAARRAAGQPDEGHRAGQLRPDERGDRPGRRRRPRTGSR